MDQNVSNFPGHEKVVRALLELGANVDPQDTDRDTPLIRAAVWGS